MDHIFPSSAGLPAMLPMNPFWPDTIDGTLELLRAGLERLSDEELQDPACKAFSNDVLPEIIFLLGCEDQDSPVRFAWSASDLRATDFARMVLHTFRDRCVRGEVPPLTFESRRRFLEVNRYQHLVLAERKCLTLIEAYPLPDTARIADIMNQIAWHLTHVTRMDFALDFDQIRFALFTSVDALRPETIHATLGHALMVAREYEFAAYPLRVAAELRGDSQRLWKTLALCHYRAGAYDTLAVLLEELTERNPTDWQYWNNLGVAYFALGMWHKAIGCYQRAFTLDIDSYEVWNNMGEVYCRLHRYDDAHAYLLRAIELAPDYAESHRLLADVYMSRGELENAQHSLARATELGDDLSPAFGSHLARILNMRSNSRSAA